MYEYQQTKRYFAQVAGGMEKIATEELRELQAANIRAAFRGLHFDAEKETLYRINYMARCISRVLAPLISFRCHSTKYLYKTAREVDWTHFLSADQTFAIFANVSNSRIRHSQYAALRLKDAIADMFMERFGRRPSVDRLNPNVWLNLHIENNQAVISLDTSGGALHRRGYRQASVQAPMQETLAAAIIRMAEWQGDRRLYDPMCGSGTLLSEALMHFCRIPAGYLRSRFGFELLPDFDRELWNEIIKRQKKEMRPLPAGLIAGSDKSKTAVRAAGQNLRMLPFGDRIKLSRLDYQDLPDLSEAVIVCNPPYGVRLQHSDGMRQFYKQFGDFLKQRCKGSTAYLYFGDRKLIPSIGLRPSWKMPLKNGGLDGRLARFELY